MRKNKRLIIDVSSIMWSALLGKGDQEATTVYGFEEKPGKFKDISVPTPVWGYERFLDVYLDALKKTGTTPQNTILVLDGVNGSSLRKFFNPNYKGQRPARPKEMIQSFNDAVDAIKDDVLSLGGMVVWQDQMEADDVIAFLCEKLEGDKVVMTRDGDMFALRNPDVQVLYRGEFDEVAKWGPIEGDLGRSYARVYKALVGDNSDNIKGCKGFGDAAFLKLVGIFQDFGIESLDKLMAKGDLSSLKEDVEAFKPLQKILDQEKQVLMSYDCGKFYADRINTLDNPIQIQSGYVKDFGEADYPIELKKYFQQKRLVTASTLEADILFALPHLKVSPLVSLDIEAATPPESDEWLERVANAGEGKKKKIGFDTLGFEITSLQLTFGDNGQHTYYIPINNKDTDNCTLKDIADFVALIPKDVPCAIQNTSFELPVCKKDFGEEHWMKDGVDVVNGDVWHGFIPNAVDTAIMASYVDENEQSGLKPSSKRILGYDQASFMDTMGIFEMNEDGSFKMVINKQTTAGKRGEESKVLIRLMKMDEKTAEEVFDYGCDDTIMTLALYNHYHFVMEIEETIDAFRQVELWAQYAISQAFLDGVPFDSDKLQKYKTEDQATYDDCWDRVKKYLISIDWKGSSYADQELTGAGIKYMAEVITGKPLKTRVRKLDKLAKACLDHGCPTSFCKDVECSAVGSANTKAKTYFVPNPKFGMGSPKDKNELLYDIWKFPVRLRGKVTETMRNNGQFVGNPKADADVFAHILKFDMEDRDKLLPITKDMQTMIRIKTLMSLFYWPYEQYPHWKTGKIHSSLGQSRTVTRRFAPSAPNVNQLPKRGEGVKFRYCFLPWDTETDFVYSPDWAAQEIRLTADRSKDENLLSCYIHPEDEPDKDVHSMTASSVAELQGHLDMAEYSEFMELLKDVDEEGKPIDKRVKPARTAAKSVNFGYVYSIMKKKLSIQLLCTEKEADSFLKAYAKKYPGVEAWKKGVIKFMHSTGYTTTMLGARRHLKKALKSEDKWIRMAAERKGVNFEIQGSAGEQAKLAICEQWVNGYYRRVDIHFYFPVHDELCNSGPQKNAEAEAKSITDVMEVPYANMIVPMISEASWGPSFGEQIFKPKVN